MVIGGGGGGAYHRWWEAERAYIVVTDVKDTTQALMD